MKKYVMLVILILAVFLQGCASKQEDNQSTASEQEAEITTAVTSPAAAGDADTTSGKEDSTSDAAADVTASPQTDLVLPVTTNDTGKTLIQTVSKSLTYKYNSYIITSANGESVVIDPTQMPAKNVVDINPAAILCTHDHPDHTDANFSQSYEVPELFYKEGEIDTKDFHIYTVLSSHSGDTLSTSNVIMVLEVDGLRIAHMGDIGQTELTKDQLEALGDIDIAFMQFVNSYSDMSLANEKGFKLIEQLNPKIIIPTHYTAAAEPVLEEKYGKITEFDNILEISKEDLQDTKLTVYEILNNHKYH